MDTFRKLFCGQVDGLNAGISLVDDRKLWVKILVLCLPAIVFACVLRWLLIHSMPEAFFGSDTNSYFGTVIDWHENGRWRDEVKRRWVYPYFMGMVSCLPGSPAVWISVIQHTVMVVATPFLGWIIWHVTRGSSWSVLAGTLAWAGWPKALRYGQEALPEVFCLVAFVVSIAMVLPCGAARNWKARFLSLLCLALLVGLKPHGRGLWLGVVIAIGLWAGWRVWRWGAASIFALTLGIAAMVSSGSARQGNWLLLSSALPLVPLEGRVASGAREILRPVIERARGYGWNYPLRQSEFKKPLAEKNPEEAVSPEWAAYIKKDKEGAYDAMGVLAKEGVMSNPVKWCAFSAIKVLISSEGTINWVWFDPKNYWDDMDSSFRAKHEGDDLIKRYYFGVAPEDWSVLVKERSHRTSPVAAWVRIASPHYAWVSMASGKDQDIKSLFLGMNAILGLAVIGISIMPVMCGWRVALLVCLPVFFYCMTVFGIGDSLQRYLFPVEWLGWIMVLLPCARLMRIISARVVSRR